MSVDIVAGVTVPVLLQQCERLAAPHRATSGGFQYASALDNSVAVISALSADLLASDARVSELQAENEKLRSALAESYRTLAEAFGRIHGLPRTSDTALANQIGQTRANIARALAKDHPNAEG